MAYKGTKEKSPPTNLFLSNRYLCLVPAIITFLVYLPTLSNGFVNWDDQLYVYENLNIRTIDSGFCKWLLTAVVSANWHPLTMLSLAMDYAMWRLNPFGYHLTNIILHTLNTFLVFIIVCRLVECGLLTNPPSPPFAKGGNLTTPPLEKGDTGGFTQNFQLLAASVTALLFGIHPLHVESVAWVSERKDVLYAFFYLLSIIAYLKFLTTRGLKSYLLSLVFFTVSLLSKPMAVSLPVVLLILDYYPFQRLNREEGFRSIRGLLIEKAPFFIAAVFFSFITLLVQQTEGAVKTVEYFPLEVRTLAAIRGYVFYLYKTVLPSDLAPFYPYPVTIDLFTFEYVGCIALFLTISFLVFRSKLFSAAWLYYLITLVPVIGIVQVGDHAAADRYTYLSGLGPFLLAGLGVGVIFERSSNKVLMGAVLLLLSAVLAGMTIKQTAVWHDSITLWSHEIMLYPKADMPYNIRGLAYHSEGDYQRAIADYSSSIEVNPAYADAYQNRGAAYTKIGNHRAAIMDYNVVIGMYPTYAAGYYNRGAAFYSLGEYRQAVMDYSKAIELNPQFSNAYNNRAAAYYATGDYRAAVQDYDKVIELEPENAAAYSNREKVFKKMGNN